MNESIPKFKIGDVICSSLSSAQEILDIRIGKPEDFPEMMLANGMPFRVSWEGDLCYVMRYLGGQRHLNLKPVDAVDGDHHLKGTEMFQAYQTVFDRVYGTQFAKD